MHEGGCLCAAIRYRITDAPAFSVVCHCATCRRASGAPAIAWVTVDRSHFRFVSGFPRSYHSSVGVVRRFCAGCGTSLTYENAGSPNTVDITTATLDNPNDFPPHEEVWLEQRVPWQPVNPALRHFARNMSEDPNSMGPTGG